jgi:hypothetical protein
MASTIHSTSSSEVVGKLIVLKESRNNYDGDLDGYKWVNKPGLPISVRQLQPETPILHADTSLLKYLTELLQSEPCTSLSVKYAMLCFSWTEFLKLFRVVRSVGVPKESGLTSGDFGYQEHEISVILVPERNGK